MQTTASREACKRKDREGIARRIPTMVCSQYETDLSEKTRVLCTGALAQGIAKTRKRGTHKLVICILCQACVFASSATTETRPYTDYAFKGAK